MVSATDISAAALAAPAVEQALAAIAPTIMSRLGRVAQSAGDKAVAALQLGFREYLTTSYNKCKTFKSILNPHTPIDVLESYVNISFTCRNNTITDEQLVKNMLTQKRVVIMGLAGSGKSMFMKYTTLHHFHHPSGKVPLFVELRHINNLTKKNLLAFVRSSCCSKSHGVTQAQFELALRAGAFVIILDGFDELNHDIREDIQRQILELDKDFPESPVIISSRRDDRFASWPSYFVYEVNPMTKGQAEKLIKSLDYDSGVKKRFLSEVNSTLYESHTSFLSSPLLTSIMMLTYEGFAEIPQKMHSFYGQAFDTLFQKHDAQKDQYQRQMHTGLAREDFKECFSAFCAMSYLNEKYSFSSDDLSETADAALKYVASATGALPKSITAKQLIDDLIESVCMLQPDGIETSFVHRSFQEYFCAIFVRSLSGDKVKKFVDRCAQRFGDSMIPMAMDMAREVLEGEWVIPTIDELEFNLKLHEPDKNIGSKLLYVLPKMSLVAVRGRVNIHLESFDFANHGRIETLSRLYPQKLERVLVLRNIIAIDIKKIDNALSENEARKATVTYKRLSELSAAASKNTGETRRVSKPLQLGGLDDWLFHSLGTDKDFVILAKSLAAIRRELGARERRKRAILTEFLN